MGATQESNAWTRRVVLGLLVLFLGLGVVLHTASWPRLSEHRDTLESILVSQEGKRPATQQKWKQGGKWKRGKKKKAARQRKWHGHPPIWRVFRTADKDHSQAIEDDELPGLSLVLQRRYGLSEKQFQLIFQEARRTPPQAQQSVWEKIVGKGAADRGSGELDMKEFRAIAGVLFVFTFADENHDGVLSGEELSLEGFALKEKLAWLHLPLPLMQELVTSGDLDGNGVLSPAELKHVFLTVQDYVLPPWLLHPFQRMDSDGSDTLEGPELEAVLPILKRQLSLSPDYVKRLLDEWPGGKPASLDRKDFKALVWKAWGGSPYQRVGPFKLRPFFLRNDYDRNGFLEDKEIFGATMEIERVFALDNDKVQGLLKTQDADGDGAMSPGELSSLVRAAHEMSPFSGMKPFMIHFFRHLDKNEDTLIDGQEVEVMKKRFEKRFKASRGQLDKVAGEFDTSKGFTPHEFQKYITALKEHLHPGAHTTPKPGAAFLPGQAGAVHLY